MSTHMAKQTVTAESTHVLHVLTDPAACGRWAPISFSTDQARGERLQAGTRTTLRGRLAGRNVTFETHVVAADERGLSLRATGPVRFDVDYRLTPAARRTLIEARITLAQTRGDHRRNHRARDQCDSGRGRAALRTSRDRRRSRATPAESRPRAPLVCRPASGMTF
jgi:hypothetical protein